MAWFRIGGSLAMHPVPRRAGLKAMGLWLMCGTYSCDVGRRGRITRSELRQFTRNTTLPQHLVNAGLWARDGDAYVFEFDGEIWDHQRRRRIPIDPKIRIKVYTRNDFMCVTCGSGNNLTLDHIWPWSLGGADTEDNLQTMCRSCNSRKGARVPHE